MKHKGANLKNCLTIALKYKSVKVFDTHLYENLFNLKNEEL